MEMIRMRPPGSREAIGLMELCVFLSKKIDCNKMVEVGSYRGESTVLFAHTFQQVYAIDPHKEYDSSDGASNAEMLDRARTELEIRMAVYPNIEHINATSIEAAQQFEDGSLDFVYLDGDHRYHGIKADIQAWLPKIAKGGYIGGHDHEPRFMGVVRAVAECFTHKLPRFFEDHSWLIKV
jgi:predicted O-methyltransferase YrrM